MPAESEKPRIDKINENHQGQHDRDGVPGRTPGDVLVNPAHGPQKQPARDDKEQDFQDRLNKGESQANIPPKTD